MKYLYILTGSLLAVAGCHSGKLASGAARGSEEGSPMIVANYELGRPIIRGNAAVVPVLRRSNAEATPDDDYVLLDEARKNGWIEISELPEQETVETLLVRNLGPRPILLIAGDLLLGGKQDRIVRKDTIIEPNETREVHVYCVEQGRWHGSSNRFEGATFGVPTSVRRSAVFEGQAAVWRDVEEKNRALAGTPTSSSVRESMNSEILRRRLDSDYEPMFNELRSLDRVVGALLLIGGEIVSLEIFGSSSLFFANLPQMLQGLIAEAESLERQSRSRPLDMEECREFVEKAVTASRRETFSSGSMKMSSIEEPVVKGVEMRSGSMSNQESDALVHGTYVPQGGR